MVKEYLKIEHLTDIGSEDFAPYGQIFGIPNEPPFEEREDFKYYLENIVLGPVEKIVEEVTCGLLILKKRIPGLPLTKLERHPLFTESFFPINGSKIIFALAPSDNTQKLPDLEKVRFFLIDGNLGILLNKGTWHWPPMAVDKDSTVMLLTKGKLFSKTDPLSGTEIVDIGYEIYPVF